MTLDAPLSNVGRVIKSLGLGRLRNLQRKVLVQRYKWEKPGDIIQVDTKQVARFVRVGHRITGDRRHSSSRALATRRATSPWKNHTPSLYLNFPDEHKATSVGFLTRAVGWFHEQGVTCRRVLSDNGASYRFDEWRKACSALDLKSIRIRPYTPIANGKAEQFIKTLLAEWAYGMAFQTSEERNRWLPRYLGLHNGRRCHIALVGLSPQ